VWLLLLLLLLLLSASGLVPISKRVSVFLFWCWFNNSINGCWMHVLLLLLLLLLLWWSREECVELGTL
jgi:hypothetical protein